MILGMHEQKAMNKPIRIEDFEIASQLMDPDGKVLNIPILQRMCELTACKEINSVLRNVIIN